MSDGMGSNLAPLARSLAKPGQAEIAQRIAQMTSQVSRERLEATQRAIVNPTAAAEREQVKQFGITLQAFCSTAADLQRTANDPNTSVAVRDAVEEGLRAMEMDPAQQADTAYRLSQQIDRMLDRIEQRLQIALANGDDTMARDALLDATEVAQWAQGLRGRFSDGHGEMLVDRTDARVDALVGGVERRPDAASHRQMQAGR
jgi:hypothetical protein